MLNDRNAIRAKQVKKQQAQLKTEFHNKRTQLQRRFTTMSKPKFSIGSIFDINIFEDIFNDSSITLWDESGDNRPDEDKSEDAQSERSGLHKMQDAHI